MVWVMTLVALSWRLVLTVFVLDSKLMLMFFGVLGMDCLVIGLFWVWVLVVVFMRFCVMRWLFVVIG